MKKTEILMVVLFSCFSVICSAQNIIISLKSGKKVLYRTETTDSIYFSKENILNGHEFVDLGLPSGTLWATTNVGGNSAEDAGNHYAWGEYETKQTYSWQTYKWVKNSGGYKVTKYCTNLNYGSVADYQTQLLSEDDAATQLWGEFWQIPSREQIQELISECDHEWTAQNGQNGYIFKSKTNSNSIFLPTGGFTNEGTLYYPQESGQYLSRTLSVDNNMQMYILGFTSTQLFCDVNGRCGGRNIRPVVAQ